MLFSQTILLALVDGGLSRDEAYRIVQELAQRAFAERISLRELCEKDERVIEILDNDKLASSFDPARLVAHTEVVFDSINI